MCFLLSYCFGRNACSRQARPAAARGVWDASVRQPVFVPFLVRFHKAGGQKYALALRVEGRHLPLPYPCPSPARASASRGCTAARCACSGTLCKRRSPARRCRTGRHLRPIRPDIRCSQSPCVLRWSYMRRGARPYLRPWVPAAFWGSGASPAPIGAPQLSRRIIAGPRRAARKRPRRGRRRRRQSRGQP